MEIRYLIAYPALLALLACLIIPFLPASRKSGAATLFILLNTVTTCIIAINALAGDPTEFSFHGGPVFGDIFLRVDALSAWFILLINVTCMNASLYGRRYLRAYLSQEKNLSLHWSAFVVFHFSMILVCAVQHGLAFLVAWEMMSVTSFLLLMFDHNRFQTLNAGINYLIQMHIGVIFLTMAFIWASVSGHSYAFEAIEVFFQGTDGTWLFLLFFIGFGFKAGFLPLHTWLPHAHPAAPSHISGTMSAIMVKMGIFGIMRTAGWLTHDLLLIGGGILVLSVVTAFYGILNGAIHRDYKKVLAFSTIENIGLIGIGIGIALMGKGSGNQPLMVIGISASLLHILNHSLYKSLLFFSAGNIYQFTHTRNMEHLGGLIKKIPVTAFFFLCGSIAICGLPPFNGFISKFLLFSGLLEGMRATDFQTNLLMLSAMVGLALVSGAALLTFAKSFGVMFLGIARDKGIHPKPEYLSSDHIPFFLILFLMLLIGLSPRLVVIPMENIILDHIPAATAPVVPAETFTMIGNVGLASLIFIVTATLIYLLRSWTVSRRPVQTGPTWACGYPMPNPKLQYTGKSFSKTLAKLFSFITSEEKKYTEIDPHTVFPSHRSYQSTYAEFIEKNVLSRFNNLLLSFMKYFSFIQRGRVQVYILYGLIFMLLLIVASLLNLV